MCVAVPSLPAIEASHEALREPQLLVKLPSWHQAFLGNLGDLIRPPKLPPLRLTSAPAPFWADVFVPRPMPWRRFAQSVACHLVALVLLIPVTEWLADRTRPLPPTAFDRAQVISYQPAEYLPPLNTLRADSGKSRKADSVPAAQPIISVPAEADNGRQTIVAAPKVKLKRDVALPNIVALSEKIWQERATMPIAPAPLTLAASMSRLSPNLESSVVAPPPDAKHLDRRRDLPQMEKSVVAPPPDLQAIGNNSFQTPLSSVIEPPPNVQAVSNRAGDVNIARTSVIAPAPQLSLSDQRAARGSSARRSTQAGSLQAIPPPPSVSAGSAAGAGSNRGTPIVALNLHPSVGAPPELPSGNRRGSFAANTAGKDGSGAGDRGKGAGSGSSSNKNLPAGLYVGNASKSARSAVAGDPSAEPARNSVNPNLLASARSPVTTQERPLQAGNQSKLTDAERQVFGDRKFYSLTLNMPNLNSAGGSWVIRFAELQKNQSSDLSTSGDLSAPAATRKVDPAYPMQLMRENVAGTVIVYAVIHSDGTVGNVRVLRSVDDRIDQYASQAVARWQFAPATRKGAPVDVEATFQIPFHPARGF